MTELQSLNVIISVINTGQTSSGIYSDCLKKNIYFIIYYKLHEYNVYIYFLKSNFVLVETNLLVVIHSIQTGNSRSHAVLMSAKIGYRVVSWCKL